MSVIIGIIAVLFIFGAFDGIINKAITGLQETINPEIKRKNEAAKAKEAKKDE